MSRKAWGRENEADLATTKILHAAEKAFVELGVSAAGMSEIADYAGCSRGTLYRYFKNRHELHLAYVERTSLSIQQAAHEHVESIKEPQERLVEFVLFTIQRVRDDPATAAWFATGTSELAARMSRSAEVVLTLTSSFVPDLPGSSEKLAEHDLLRRWLVRIVVSLLTDPAGSATEERELIERFLVPAVFNRHSNRQD